ncbi:hypothetical protein TNCV_3010831 [Trichonephila clavipes]|nr:hypothetical protein TNCV_3010831 [Trichonephila clavipes]
MKTLETPHQVSSDLSKPLSTTNASSCGVMVFVNYAPTHTESPIGVTVDPVTRRIVGKDASEAVSTDRKITL